MKNLIALSAVAGAMVVVAVGGTAGAANAATASSPVHGESHVAAVRSDSCSSNWTKGWTSVDLTIQNNTNVPMTYDPDLSGPSTGHWNQRPATTLEPGQCEVVNAYAATDAKIFNFNVVYTTAGGDYIPFEGTANSTNPSFNPNVFGNLPEYHQNNYYWSGAIDSTHDITSSGQWGSLHTHFNLAVN